MLRTRGRIVRSSGLFIHSLRGRLWRQVVVEGLGMDCLRPRTVAGPATGLPWRSMGMAAVTLAMFSGMAPAAPTGEAVSEVTLPRIVFQGTISLPDSAVDAAGNHVVVTGLSGIAWLGEDRYAAVMDNSQYLLLFRLSLTQTGKPLKVESLRIVTLSQRHDYEDVVPCPAAVARALRRQPRPDSGKDAQEEEFVFLCEEDTPAIRVFSLADGSMVAAVPLPDNLRDRRPNRGLESLAIEPDGRSLWTANEEALAADGPPAAAGGGTVVRLTRLPLPVDGPPARSGGAVVGIFQGAYRVDPVHQFVRMFAGQPLSGLSALAALGNGRLLALERSGAPGLPPFNSRIYLVDAGAGVNISAVERDLASRREAILEKRLLWADSLGINLEGLCLGPTLADGNRSLVSVADNGGIGTPNQLVGLALVSPTAAFDPALLGVTVALIAIAVLVGRLSSP